MREDTELQSFLAASNYSDPVDIKKLRFIYRAVLEFASRAGKAPANLRVLEIACGDGGVTLSVGSLGCKVRAFDIDEADVDSLRRSLSERKYDNVSVTVEDVFAFDDGEIYDVVIVSEVLEHVLDPFRVASIVKRHMSAGSYLIVTTPNGYGPWELKNAVSPRRVLRRWNWLRRLTGKPEYVVGAGRDHCQRFTKRGLVELFLKLSFRLIDFSKSDFVFTMIRSLRRSHFFGRLDAKLADALPHWMASGWYLVFVLDEEPPAGESR